MSDTVRDIQALLQARGYRVEADGQAGPVTLSSILAELHRTTPSAVSFEKPMAWGAKVSAAFRARVRWISDELQYPEPGDLMTCIAWETGRTFSPSVVNKAGSGATGLIQFMPATAKGLGTTTAALATMTAEDQLNFVYKYFAPYKGRLKTLGDLYMAILWPKAVGQPDDYVLFQGAGSIAYRQNAGLDANRDAKVTKAETAAKLYAMRAEGQRPENMG